VAPLPPATWVLRRGERDEAELCFLPLFVQVVQALRSDVPFEAKDVDTRLSD